MSGQEHDLPGGAVRYSRWMRLSWAVALGALITVGVGVYDLLGFYETITGNALAASAYLLLAIISIPIVLTLAERAAVVPGEAGPYSLTRVGGFLWITFGNGWILLAGYAVLLALLGWGAALHLDIFLGDLFGLSVELRFWGVIILFLLLLNNLLSWNIRWRTRIFLVQAAIFVLILVFLRDLLFSERINFSPSFLFSYNDLPQVTVMMFSGLWGIFFVLSERNRINRPTKTMLPALILVVLLGGVLGFFGSLIISSSAIIVDGSLVPLIDLEVMGVLFPPEIIRVLYAIFGLTINLLAINYVIPQSLVLMDQMTNDGFLPRRWQSILTPNNVPALPSLGIVIIGMLLLLSVSLDLIIFLTALFFLWGVATTLLPDLFQSHPDLPETRKLKLPFHPLFPGLVVAIGLLAPVYLGLETLVIGFAWVLLGTGFYMGLARRGAIETRRKTVVVSEVESVVKKRDIAGYRVMVALTDPSRVQDDIRSGIRIAKARNGVLIVLRIHSLPSQIPEHLRQEFARKELENLQSEITGLADQTELDVRPMIRLSPKPSPGILDAVHEEEVDLLLVSWDGQLRDEETIPDPLINSLVRYAACEMVVLKGSIPLRVQNVLIPTAGGPYAPYALHLADDLISTDNGRLEVTTLLDEDLKQEEAEARQHLEEILEDFEPQYEMIPSIKSTDSIASGILRAGAGSDLILLGISREGAFDRPYFGGLPTQVAHVSDTPTLAVRRKDLSRYPNLYRMTSTVLDAFPTLTAERQETVAENMRVSAIPSIDFFVMIVISAVIATLGLLQDSTAVVIGAMLVAPLMSPILAMSMGMVLGEYALLRTATEAMLKGVALAIFVAILVVLFSPIKVPTASILSRTEPNLLDLMVALASGAAAGYAICRKEVAAALPGVAIAAALVPPLCVVGFGLATGDLDITSGALLLFITNLIAIIFSAAVVFLAVGFLPSRRERKELKRGFQFTIVSLGLITVILVVATTVTIIQLDRQQKVEAIFTDEIVANAAEVSNISITRQNNGFLISATVISYADEILSAEEFLALEEELTQAVGGPVKLDLTLIVSDRMVSDISELGELSLLRELFLGEMAAFDVTVSSLKLERTSEGMQLAADLFVYDEDLTETALLEIQARIDQKMGLPTEYSYVLLLAEQLELEAEPNPTATATALP